MKKQRSKSSSSKAKKGPSSKAKWPSWSRSASRHRFARYFERNRERWNRKRRDRYKEDLEYRRKEQERARVGMRIVAASRRPGLKTMLVSELTGVPVEVLYKLKREGLIVPCAEAGGENTGYFWPVEQVAHLYVASKHSILNGELDRDKLMDLLRRLDDGREDDEKENQGGSG
jgi:hypothetical protein